MHKADEDGGNVNDTYYAYGDGIEPQVQISETSSSTQVFKYIYGPTGLLAYNKNGTLYFVIRDHLGSTRNILDQNNAVVNTMSYLPFGGSMAQYTNINNALSKQFTGQEYDEETGLYNYKARMYDEVIGRFYGVDPAGQFASPYTGMGNNPINMIDPDGQFGLWGHFQRVGRMFGDVQNGDWGSLKSELSDYAIESAIAVGSYYIGGAVSGATGSQFAGTMASNYVSGGLNAGHNSNWNPYEIARGAGFGVLSAGAGYLVGDGLASQGLTGLGTFMGGATSSGLNTGLNGGSTRQIMGSAILSGSMNYGMYQLSTTKSFRSLPTKVKGQLRILRELTLENKVEYRNILDENGNILGNQPYIKGSKDAVFLDSDYLDILASLQKGYDIHTHIEDGPPSGYIVGWGETGDAYNAHWNNKYGKNITSLMISPNEIYHTIGKTTMFGPADYKQIGRTADLFFKQYFFFYK